MTRARQTPQSAERKLLNFRGKNTNSRSYCLRATDREVGCNLSILFRVDAEFGGATHSRGDRFARCTNSLLGCLLSLALFTFVGICSLFFGHQLCNRGLWRGSSAIKLADAGAA